MGKLTTKQIKDKTIADKGARVQKAKAMSNTIQAKRAEDIEAVKAAAVSFAPAISMVVDNTKKDSRYKGEEAEYGFTVPAGQEGNKPSEVQFVGNEKHYSLAATIYEGDAATAIEAIKSIGKDVANMQGRIQAALVGLAARLQIEGEKAMPLVEAFIDAIQPYGKGLTHGVNAMRSWLEAFAAVDYVKGEKGEGKVLKFSRDKHKSLGNSFGRNRDTWIGERMAKLYSAFKPEKEPGDFDFVEELRSLLDRAKKAKDGKGKYKSIDLSGYAEVAALATAIKREAAPVVAAETEQAAS